MMRQVGAGLRDNSNSFSLHSYLGFCLCVTHSLTLVCTAGATATRASGLELYYLLHGCAYGFVKLSIALTDLEAPACMGARVSL